jgi:glycoprotein endo-alpha-1,2-mannosidase
MKTRLLVATTALALALVGAATATSQSSPRSVGIFYYAWYGTPARDGAWQHWNQNGRTPPADLASSGYPSRGPYSSSDPEIIAAQMREIANAGIDTVIVSWWGVGSVEDARLPLVAEAARQERLRLAIHVEPYVGRTPASVAADIARLRPLGFRDFYVYDSSTADDAGWAAALARVAGARVFANTSLVGKALRGRFQGIYTYDVLVNGGASFRRVCKQAQATGLLCAPSVGPGFHARRATPVTAIRDRRDGSVYDRSWASAVAAAAPMVTITSYNEWHEGTQIEPATLLEGYASYEGAYGLRGTAAETAYLDRTRAWIKAYKGLAPPPPPTDALPLSFVP